MKRLLISQYKNTNFFQRLFYNKIFIYSKDDDLLTPRKLFTQKTKFLM